MKAIVISGGGSKGAYAAGVCKYLIEDKKKEYDIYVGTSTGSLVSTMLAAGDVDGLVEAYTSITPEDIFKVNPFRLKQKKDGTYEIKLKYLTILWRIIKGEKSIGDTSTLLKTINKFFSKKDFNNAFEKNKKISVCVSNLTNQKAEYKTNFDENMTYEDFCLWMAASCSAPPVFSTIEKDENIYVDGGVLDPIPIQRAIDMGATEIDVVILKEENPLFLNKDIKNVVGLSRVLLEMLNQEIGLNDIKISELNGENKNIKINLYYTPRTLTKNSLIFNKEEMKAWYKEGYDNAKARYKKTYKIIDGKKIMIFNGMEE